MAGVTLAIPKGNGTCDAELMAGRVEEVIRAVTALGLGIVVGGIATLGRWLSAMSVDALNRRDAREQTLSSMPLGFHQQPWNRIRIEGVHLGRHLARNFAAIL